jgi:hypothetical protein
VDQELKKVGSASVDERVDILRKIPGHITDVHSVILRPEQHGKGVSAVLNIASAEEWFLRLKRIQPLMGSR